MLSAGAVAGPALIVSWVLTAVLISFLALNYAETGSMLPGDWSGLDGSRWADQPLYSALESTGVALLGAFGVFLLVDAAISPAGTGRIYMGDTARTLYGMALHGSMPPASVSEPGCRGWAWSPAWSPGVRS
ncbi:hypothetical protein AB0H34_22510 [Saccharopolyspora shandongensis]|uniref:hypothetical protein n=1 Tax=Saccharopolyspora shandongensis TaxID=418495 RepID=UPI0033F39315